MQSSVFTRWLASRPPTAALEIDARRVTAVSLAGRGPSRVLSGHATAALPAGAVEPALNAPNVHDGAALAAAVRTVLDALSPRPRRVALVLPDTVAKLSLLRFDTVAPKAQDLEQLIRWQMRKATPFKIEDAQLAWFPGARLPEGGREFVVTAARRDIIESYERACASAGAHAGIVDMATLNLVNAVIASSRAVRGLAPRARRGRLRDAGGRARTGTDLLPEPRRGCRRRSRGARAPDRDVPRGPARRRRASRGSSWRAPRSRGAEHADMLRRSVEDRLGARVEALDIRGAVTLRDRISVAPDLLDAVAPGVGVILREQVA